MISKKGTVVKKSGDKTIRVEVNERRPHPKYKKQYRITTNYLVHDEENKAKDGDEVVITQARPTSKKKSWNLTSIEKSAQ